jgi:hypothetical protein
MRRRENKRFSSMTSKISNLKNLRRQSSNKGLKRIRKICNTLIRYIRRLIKNITKMCKPALKEENSFTPLK